MFRRFLVVLAIVLASIGFAAGTALANPNPPPLNYDVHWSTFYGQYSLEQCTAQGISDRLAGLHDDFYCWETAPGSITELWVDMVA